MIPFYTARQSRALDRYAIEQAGFPGLLLMKRAGLFAFDTLRQRYPDSKRLLVVCGGGNNGGDGFVIAQLAAMGGLHVDVALATDPEKLKNDARRAYQEMCNLGIDPKPFDSLKLADYDLIVDALFGTGLDRPIEGRVADWIKAINLAAKPVLAIDVPSGLDADSGRLLGGPAIKAHRTCTFIARKTGLYQFQGPDHAGQVHFSDLFLPGDVFRTERPIACNHPLKHWLRQLPARPQSAHKGSRGTVCLVGGDHHMMGAIQMAGLAALKVGSGLVKVVTRPQHETALTQAQPELMCYTPQALPELMQTTNVIGLGPGLGLGEWGQNLFKNVCLSERFKVLDADALKQLAKEPQKRDDWVLTPHPGEAAALLGCDTITVQNDRIQAVRRLQQQYGGVVVLKGNGSLICDGERLEICLAGNPGMAVGGMGDVLTGAISGLIAQGMPLFEAACLGVNLHAHAGDVLAGQHGEAGLLPTEVAATLSQIMVYAD